MAVHHGGRIGQAGKVLASKVSSRRAKSQAGRALATHKTKQH